MNEIERFARPERFKPGASAFGGNGNVERLRAGDREDGVIEIGFAGAVARGAMFIELARKEVAHQIGGISEKAWSEARNLQQLQTQTHPASATWTGAAGTGATSILTCCFCSCSCSLHQPLISTSLKILPSVRRRSPFRLAFSNETSERIASSL